jgi:hypothetical protein
MDLFSANVAYAASTNFNGFITNVDTIIINPLIKLLFALALVYFLYGVYEFIAHQDNEEAKTKGKEHIIWGLVGLTIMFGVWTILGIMLNTMNIPKSQIDLENGKVVLPNLPN